MYHNILFGQLLQILTVLSTTFLCSYNIEKQAAKFYTREVFDRFQKLIAENTSYNLEQQEAGGVGLHFALVASDGNDARTYRVQADVVNGSYECSCNMFDMCGLICPHIVRVMVHLNVQLIPERYLLERWSDAATKGAPVPDAYNHPGNFGIPGSKTLRYNRLCRKMNNLASMACFSDETYELVSAAVDSLSAEVDAKKRRVQQDEPAPEGQGAEVPLQAQHQQPPVTQNQQPPAQGGLKNPPRQPKKGRPTEAEKRKKTLVEQRQDAAKKKRKGKLDEETSEPPNKKKKATKKTRCPFCFGDHHVSDCLVLKATKVQDATMAQGAVIQQENMPPDVELDLRL